MDFSLRANLKSVILLLIIGCIGLWFFYWVFNPRDLNQLTIISEAQLETVPASVEFSGEVDWSQKFHSNVTIQGGFLYFTTINNAWYSGQVSILDEQGNLILSEKVTPRGRYCGNYVVLVRQDGSSRTAWNEFPSPEILKTDEDGG